MFVVFDDDDDDDRTRLRPPVRGGPPSCPQRSSGDLRDPAAHAGAQGEATRFPWGAGASLDGAPLHSAPPHYVHKK